MIMQVDASELGWTVTDSIAERWEAWLANQTTPEHQTAAITTQGTKHGHAMTILACTCGVTDGRWFRPAGRNQTRRQVPTDTRQEGRTMRTITVKVSPDYGEPYIEKTVTLTKTGARQTGYGNRAKHRPVYSVELDGQIIGTIDPYLMSTDTKIAGTRLRRPGVGRQGFQSRLDYATRSEALANMEPNERHWAFRESGGVERLADAVADLVSDWIRARRIIDAATGES